MRLPLTLALVVFAGMPLAGCTSQTSTTPTVTPAATDSRGPTIVPASPGLNGTIWRLESLGGTAAIPGVEATLEFPEEGKVGGRASCNRFFGTVEISGESMTFGPLAATKMACLDGAMNAQEKKYLEALQAAERFAFDGPALLVYPRGGGAPLRFTRK